MLGEGGIHNALVTYSLYFCLCISVFVKLYFIISVSLNLFCICVFVNLVFVFVCAQLIYQIHNKTEGLEWDLL